MKSKMLVALVALFSWLAASAPGIDLLKEDEAKIKREVWDSYRTVDKYIKSDPEFRNRREEKAKYQAALATERKWLTVDRRKIFEAWRKKQKPIWSIRFDINICPDRIQTFVNNSIAHIQFYKIGKAAQIEIFAEGGQAAFSGMKAFETGAGAHWKKFTRPILNHLP